MKKDILIIVGISILLLIGVMYTYHEGQVEWEDAVRNAKMRCYDNNQTYQI